MSDQSDWQNSMRGLAMDELHRMAKRYIELTMHSRNLMWQATAAITHRDTEIAVMAHPKLLNCATDCRKIGLHIVADLLVRYADCLSDLVNECARLELDRLEMH